MLKEITLLQKVRKQASIRESKILVPMIANLGSFHMSGL